MPAKSVEVHRAVLTQAKLRTPSCAGLQDLISNAEDLLSLCCFILSKPKNECASCIYMWIRYFGLFALKTAFFFYLLQMIHIFFLFVEDLSFMIHLEPSHFWGPIDVWQCMKRRKRSKASGMIWEKETVERAYLKHLPFLTLFYEMNKPLTFHGKIPTTFPMIT